MWDLEEKNLPPLFCIMLFLTSMLCSHCRNFVLLFMIFLVLWYFCAFSGPGHFHIPQDKHAEYWFLSGILQTQFPCLNGIIRTVAPWTIYFLVLQLLLLQFSFLMIGKIPSACSPTLPSLLSSEILLLSEGWAHFCKSLWDLPAFCWKSLYSLCSSCLSYKLL